MMPNQPVMVQVQKPDGTFVEMPLEEVQKLTQTSPDPAPVKPAHVAEPVVLKQKAAFPQIAPEQKIEPKQKVLERTVATPALAPKQVPMVAPVVIQRKPVKRAVQGFSQEDSSSLLDESVPVAHAHLPRVSAQRETEVTQVVSGLSFKVAAEHSNRLRTIIQLRLKDVRDAQQTKELLVRKVLDGGVGLSEDQASEVLRACAAFEPESMLRAVQLQPEKRATVPAVFHPSPAPATATPYNNFVHAAHVQPAESVHNTKTVFVTPVDSQPAQAVPVTTKRTTSAPLPEEIIETFKLSSTPRTRATMHDVVVKPVEMNAIDEIKYVSLTDFRRMGTKPEESALRLKQKFVNLKEESILFYLDALSAWQLSPLYLEYVASLTKSLAQHKTVAQVLAESHAITLPEIQALAQMNKAL